ncbi:MAG: glycosyltransferase family 4 protein [Ginsengibacter sp.]
MKILFFIDSLQAGGKERRLTELMKELKKDSPIEFELVVMNREIYYKQVLDLKIRIHYLIRKTKKDLSIFRQFYAIGKSFRPDIIHCWDSMTAIYAIPTCKLLNIKLVNGLVVDTPVKGIHNKYRSRAKLTFPFSNLIIGNSKAGLSAYNAPAGKSACVYNGMDLNRFENLEDPLSVLKKIFKNEYQGLFIVGMVAAFEDRKDYRTLIKTAIRMVKEHENIRFIMVGDGSNLNEIKKTIPLLLTDKIIFLGKRSDVESIVNVFDVGILLTNSKVHGEGISNSLIEYLALGKAAIATRGGGTDEVIVDNENGYLIDPENEDQLVNKIEIIMQNQELKKRLGDFGYKFAREKFDLKIMSDNYITIYKTLINKK